MSSSQKITFNRPWFFSIVALVCLGFIFVIFIQNKEQISFHEKVKNQNQLLIDEMVQRAIAILKANEDLKANIAKEKRTIAVDQYNKIANDFNQLNQEIGTNSFFDQYADLKKLFIETNNEALKFIESTHHLLSSHSTNIQPVNSSSFNERYESLTQHPSVKEFSISNFNKPTFIFVLGILGFIIASLLAIWTFAQSSFQLKNLLVQKESELKTFLSVIDNMSEGVIVSDRFGFFTYYNQSALDIIGKGIKDIYYQSSLDLIGFHDTQGAKLSKADSPFHKGVKKDIVTDQEIFVKNQIHPNGIYISASNGFFVDEKGDTLGAVVVMKNISHKKQMEELWKNEKQLAIEGSQKKSDFLASMSHEIRTPMNGIIGLTTLLSDTPLNDQQNEFVNIIRRSAYSLLALINDILDHSKIEAGKIELIQSNFDIHFLIKDVLENFRFPCAEKNNQLHLEFDPKMTNYYVADENRIRQILINLVGNAVKFTSNGQISIQCDLTQENPTESVIKFSVRDTGPGMDQAELDRLFQRFFQTKTGIKFGGTGLGLSICKQLVDLMHGKIGVTSQPGQGSTFWFELTLQKGTATISTSKNSQLSDFKNTFAGHILVAEDNVINQKVIYQYLTKIGFTADIANNGSEAVDLFQKNKYNLILMDCNMPVLNGYQATQKINELQKNVPSEKQIKVVALTAEGQVTGLTKCLEAGMSDFINKPILIDEFVTVIKKYVFVNENFDKNSLYKLKELTVGNDLLLEVLFDEYRQSTPAIIQSMKNFSLTQDFENLADTAHSLKSASGTLGAKKVQSICQKLESLRDGQIPVPLELLTELEKEFKISLTEIENEIQTIKKSDQGAA